MNNNQSLRIAIVGATGLVGRTIFEVLHERKINFTELILLASKRSAGQIISYGDSDYQVQELTKDTFIGIDYFFFCAGSLISEGFVDEALKYGIVIDNSSLFRMSPHIPLVVASINGKSIKKSRIIANANCSTIPCVILLNALKNRYGIMSVNYATYQSVSGSGMRGIDDLEGCLNGEMPQYYPHNIALTCIPQIGDEVNDYQTTEELKMQEETKKILDCPDLLVSATCVRVPVKNCHGVIVRAELKSEFEIDDIKKLFASIANVKVVDNLQEQLYPTSIIATGTDNIYVGRIRCDKSAKNGILFYVVADNIRTGAASSSVDILEYLLKERTIIND